MKELPAATPAEGSLRVTVPIHGASLSDDSAPGYVLKYPQRCALAPGVEIAALSDAETDRLKNHFGEYTFARLELFNRSLFLESSSEHPTSSRQVFRSHQIVATEIDHIFRLQALVTRCPFIPMSAVVDQYRDQTRQRVSPLLAQYHSRTAGRNAPMLVSRLQTWSQLIMNWPTTQRDRLDLALTLYQDSVEARWFEHDHRGSILAAATATEVLLGGDNSEISYKLAQRGAQLVAPGPRGKSVRRELSRLYGQRSKVIHLGRQPAEEDCVLWHQFLMAALPRAAAFAGSDNDLVVSLDDSGFERSPGLAAIDGPGWWSYCDFPRLLGSLRADPARDG